MKTKIDKSLEEVWEMKSQAHKQFKNSEFNSYLDYINSRQLELQLKYNLFSNKINNKEQLELI